MSPTRPHPRFKRITAILIAIPLMCAFAGPELRAQEDPRALDPADIFFQAWLELKRAEKLEGEEKFNEAWQKYRQAANYYDILKRFHKEWKPHLVASRIESTQETIAKLEPKATAELAAIEQKTKDLVEGPSSGDANNGNKPASGFGAPPPSRPPPPAADQKLTARLKQLEQENQSLKNQLDSARAANQAAAKESQSARTAMQANTTEQKRLEDLVAKKEREIRLLRDVLARAPLQQDMDRITREKQTLERELEITARALKTSRDKLTEAELAAEKHRADTNLAIQRAEQIEKDMQLQGDINNRVIRELRIELKNVTGLLEQSRKQLGDANTRVTQIQRSLDQAQATITELTMQRDELRVERDTLANTLKKSDSKGVQSLITENMRLGRELKEARDRLTFLEKNHDASKDDLIRARNDLTVAKTRILDYQQEHAIHKKTITSLETQLQDARKALVRAKSEIDEHSSSSAQEEIEILRGTVKRLLAAQERRRMGEKILWETYQKSKINDGTLAKAIEDIRKIKIDLTDEEKEFVTTHRTPDGEFKNPERVPIAHALAHADALQSELAYVESLIIRHVEKGRLQSAHSVLIDINERVPGNYRILCKLGVIEMKLGNFDHAIQCLDEAITMREHSSYAHFMLGIAQYKNNDLDSARNAFERSLELKPQNAKAHLYLGNLAGAANRLEQAEHHFLSTVKIDPTIPDAYYNLSVLYLQQKRKADALDYYHKALDHGATPDQALEGRLKS